MKNEHNQAGNHELPSSVSFFHLKMVFEQHGITSSDAALAKTADVKAHLKSFFRPNEYNIFLAEAADFTVEERNRYQRYMDEGYGIFNSHAKAYIYAAILVHPEYSSRKAEITRRFDELYQALRSEDTNEGNMYRYATLDALDEVVREQGVYVKVELEPAIDKDQKVGFTGIKDLDKSVDQGDFKRAFDVVKGLMTQVGVRNRNVRDYIEKSASKANENKKQTNLFVLMGTYHAHIKNILSPELASYAEMIVEGQTEEERRNAGFISRVKRRVFGR